MNRPATDGRGFTCSAYDVPARTGVNASTSGDQADTVLSIGRPARVPSHGVAGQRPSTVGGCSPMNATAHVDLFTVWLSAAGAGRDTIRVRRRHLLDLAAAVDDLLEVTTSDLAAWLAAHPWGHSARQQARASLRLFYGWLVDEGRLQSSPAARLPKVRHPRPTSRPAPLAVIAAALLRARPREQRMILVARNTLCRKFFLGSARRAHPPPDPVRHDRPDPLAPAAPVPPDDTCHRRRPCPVSGPDPRRSGASSDP